MTEDPHGNYPPPPEGSYPPPGGYPPPLPGGFPPPPAAGYGSPPVQAPAFGQLPPGAYTPWLTRVLAWIIDFIPYLIILGIGLGIEAVTQETVCVVDDSEFNLGEYCATGNSTLGVAAVSIAALLGLAYMVWNYGYRQGTTGSSIGKSIMKFKVVSEKTGQPIGFGVSVVRQIAHAVDAIICYIGFLFPLWDAKRQTLADKIMSTVCLPTGQ